MCGNICAPSQNRLGEPVTIQVPSRRFRLAQNPARLLVDSAIEILSSIQCSVVQQPGCSYLDDEHNSTTNMNEHTRRCEVITSSSFYSQSVIHWMAIWSSWYISRASAEYPTKRSQQSGLTAKRLQSSIRIDKKGIEVLLIHICSSIWMEVVRHKGKASWWHPFIPSQQHSETPSSSWS